MLRGAEMDKEDSCEGLRLTVGRVSGKVEGLRGKNTPPPARQPNALLSKKKKGGGSVFPYKNPLE